MIPANAVWFTMILSILLNLIILGSSQAFNALMSLQLVALMATYGLSISVMLWRRLFSPEKLPPCQWSLGRWGVPVNAVAIAYCIFAFFFCFWPMTKDIDVTTANWAPVMFVGVMIISIVLYFVRGRKVYDGPVVTVEGFLAERRLEGFGPMRPGH
jgi:choline transport protein